MEPYLSFQNIPGGLPFDEAWNNAMGALQLISRDADRFKFRTSQTVLPHVRRLEEWLYRFPENMRSPEMRLPEATRARVCYAETGMRLTLDLFKAVRSELPFLEAYRSKAQADYEKHMSIISIEEVPLKKGDRKRGIIEEDLPYESKYAIARRGRREFADSLIRRLEELLHKLSLKGGFMRWWLKQIVINVPSEYKSLLTALTRDNLYYLKCYAEPTNKKCK